MVLGRNICSNKRICCLLYVVSCRLSVLNAQSHPTSGFQYVDVNVLE